MTTVISLGLYALLTWTVLNPQNSMHLAIANILSWIAAVSFAYITNRKYVFESKSKQIIQEACSFYLSRISTLLIDICCMHIMVQWFNLNDRIAKLIVQVIILVTNYILSRFLVFQKKRSEPSNSDNQSKGD